MLAHWFRVIKTTPTPTTHVKTQVVGGDIFRQLSYACTTLFPAS
jgi:hypothetical protein